MIQDAIRTLVALMNKYPDTFMLSIVHENHLEIRYSIEAEYFKKVVYSTDELLEFLEKELKE